ncbi:MAG: restriction endonuclease subunit S, partial [Dysgonamonadaceae bacterium]
MNEWKEYKLGEITTKIGSGATPRGGSNNYKEFGISLIRSQNVLDFAFTSSGLAFIDENQAQELDGVTVQENDILFNITGDSVARCCVVPKQYLPARVNQHVSIVRSNDFSHFKYVFYYLQYLKPELLISAEIGATRNAITKGMLENISVLLPPLPEQKAIASILSSLDDKIALLHHQNATLEKMAETLFRQWFVEEAKEEWAEVELGSVIETTSGGTPSRKNMLYYANGIIPWVKSKELSGTFISKTEEYITNEALSNSSAKILPRNSILIAMY